MNTRFSLGNMDETEPYTKNTSIRKDSNTNHQLKNKDNNTICGKIKIKLKMLFKSIVSGLVKK